MLNQYILHSESKKKILEEKISTVCTPDFTKRVLQNSLVIF